MESLAAMATFSTVCSLERVCFVSRSPASVGWSLPLGMPFRTTRLLTRPWPALSCSPPAPTQTSCTNWWVARWTAQGIVSPTRATSSSPLCLANVTFPPSSFSHQSQLLLLNYMHELQIWTERLASEIQFRRLLHTSNKPRKHGFI